MKKVKQILLCLITLSLLSCLTQEASNQLSSKDYRSKQQRIQLIQEQLICPSNILDAEFELFNANGFSNQRLTVPGASSWSYLAVIKVNNNDADKWIDGMKKSEYNASEITPFLAILNPVKSDWKTSSEPELYKREDSQTTLILFREEGIIMKNIFAN